MPLSPNKGKGPVNWDRSGERSVFPPKSANGSIIRERWRQWLPTDQDGRVVKALDLSSNGQMSAWVRTPLLAKVLRCLASVQATAAWMTNPCDTTTDSNCSRGQLLASCCSSSALGGQPIGNPTGPFCGFRSNRVISSPLARHVAVPSSWASISGSHGVCPIQETSGLAVERPVCTARSRVWQWGKLRGE